MKKITSVLFLFYCFSVGWAQTVPPCTLEITDAETFARDWTVIDVNSDVSANTWAYNDGNAMYMQDKSNAADDWLIAPAVTLEAGKAYKVSAYVKHSSTFGSDKQKIELKIGTAPTVEGLTTRLVYDESFQSRLFVEKSGTFSPAESGVFYVGLRCYSESYNGDLYFQKIVIEEAPVYPAQITDLSIVAGERGAMSATLSWTWPSSDHLGGALSNLLGAKIYRGTDLVATLDTATVGGKAGWIDSSIETAGNYTYKVVAYNTFGNSQGSATTVTSPWIGNDTPAAVTDLVALAEDATVSLSFTPPTVGKNGGYIDTEALTYEIGRTPGGVLSESFSGPFPYIDEDVPAPGKYEYRVIGYVEENAGEAAVVESAWIGADTPKSVTDVELTDVEGKPQVTFRAPAEGVNGGYIDVENLRYRIVRDPGSEMLTESLTDTVYVDSDDLSLALYRYTVTTLSGDMESESVTSNALVFGSALGLPYETSMDSADEMALWTIVDANNDTKSWVYDATEKEMKYTAYSAADDWLFTPPFEAKKGSHTLEFRARAEKYRYPESIEVTLGSDVLPGESQTVIASYPEINSTLSELYTVDFSVPSDGVWYIGLHATTRDPWGLYISSCSIISNVISGIDGLECMNEVYFDRSNHSLVFDKGGDIQIINAAGVTVVSCESESGRMDLSQLPAGLYIAHVVTEEGKTIQIKFIK